MLTVKELRASTHMTQQEFADFFEIPKRTIEEWERGARKCSLYLLSLMEYKLIKEGIIKS